MSTFEKFIFGLVEDFKAFKLPPIMFNDYEDSYQIVKLEDYFDPLFACFFYNTLPEIREQFGITEETKEQLIKTQRIDKERIAELILPLDVIRKDDVMGGEIEWNPLKPLIWLYYHYLAGEFPSTMVRQFIIENSETIYEIGKPFDFKKYKSFTFDFENPLVGTRPDATDDERPEFDLMSFFLELCIAMLIDVRFDVQRIKKMVLNKDSFSATEFNRIVDEVEFIQRENVVPKVYQLCRNVESVVPEFPLSTQFRGTTLIDDRTFGVPQEEEIGELYGFFDLIGQIGVRYRLINWFK